MIQPAHTIQTEPRALGIGRLHQWWLSRGSIKILLVSAIFFWASYRQPIVAIALGALLADYVMTARGHWLLRVLIAWLLLNLIYFALTGQL